MLKKTVPFCLSLSMFLAGVAFSQEFTAMAMPEPSIQQDKASPDVPAEVSANQDAASAAAAAQNQVQLDRSGVNRASVHLQILQQTTPRFTETVPPAKKTVAEDKKTPAKTTGNS